MAPVGSVRAMHFLAGHAVPNRARGLGLASRSSRSCLAPRITPFGPNHRDFDEHGPRPDFPDDNHAGPRGPGPFHGHRPHGPPFSGRALFDIPIYLALASLGHAFFYFRRSQQRDRRAMELENQLERARLQALRMQLQPHFLFNTLNAISTLVQTDPRVAQEMIGNLGHMLRLSLDSGHEPEVELQQELEFLDSYLEIARARFSDRLRINKDVSPETLRALVPTFVLQPLVENAIRHGIEPKSSPGTVEIHAARAAQQLVISISDTGVGLSATAETGTSGGIGLSNTRARLQSLYPGQHVFSVQNRSDGGCVAELRIPFHTAPMPHNGKAEQDEHSNVDC
jgi:anti-sigma regulatory factor (Ser/Thr protein kinase)